MKKIIQLFFALPVVSSSLLGDIFISIWLIENLKFKLITDQILYVIDFTLFIT